MVEGNTRDGPVLCDTGVGVDRLWVCTGLLVVLEVGPGDGIAGLHIHLRRQVGRQTERQTGVFVRDLNQNSGRFGV